MSRKAVFFSGRVYRRLLVAYPQTLRETYGDEMAQLFRDQCREELERLGMRGLAWLWVVVLLDLFVSVLRERGRLLVTSSSRLVRWGGISAIAGGAAGVLGGLLLVLETVRPGTTGALVSMSSLLVIFGGSFFAAGLSGLYELLKRRSRKLALPGTILTGLSAFALFVFGVATLISWNHPTRYVQYQDSPLHTTLSLINFWSFNVGYLAGVAGLFLLGLTTLRTRALGRWSILPAILCFLCTPALFFSLLFLYSGGTMEANADLSSGLVLGLLPTMLPGGAAVLLGYLLWSRGRTGVASARN